jgi:hypothetical protein
MTSDLDCDDLTYNNIYNYNTMSTDTIQDDDWILPWNCDSPWKTHNSYDYYKNYSENIEEKNQKLLDELHTKYKWNKPLVKDEYGYLLWPPPYELTKRIIDMKFECVDEDETLMKANLQAKMVAHIKAKNAEKQVPQDGGNKVSKKKKK